MKNKVVVTGGAGFIGSHLVERLVRRGASVTVIDDLSAGSTGKLESVLEDVRFVQADILDTQVLRAELEGADVVFHLAARVSVPESFLQPALYERVLSQGTRQVIEAAVEAGVRRVVYAASSSAYGEPEVLPIPETHPIRPQSPYAAMKLAGEDWCVQASKAKRIETVRTRFFNVYGPRQEPTSPYSGVIARFVHDLPRGEARIYGDGLQTRDFVHVTDVARALEAAAMAPSADARVFNIGTGQPTTILGLAQAIAKALGCPCKIEHLEARSGDIRVSLADVREAQNGLGFRAEVALDAGIRDLVMQGTNA